MRKSQVIAPCLVNSNMINRLTDAEESVRQVFLFEFPKCNYLQWNCEIYDSVAEQIIKNVGLASKINVRKFIDDLWNK